MITVSMPQDEFQTRLDSAATDGKQVAARQAQIDLANAALTAFKGEWDKVVIPESAEQSIKELFARIRKVSKNAQKTT